MAGNNNFDEPQDFREAWRRQEKRQQRQERRTPGASGAVVSNEGLAERVFQGSSREPTLSEAFMLPAADWSIDTQAGFSHQESYGSLVQWYVTVTRAGADISVPSTGNIVNSTIGTLRVGWVPVMNQPTNNGGAGRLSSFVITSDGLVQISAVTPGGGDIATGEQFGFGAFYIATSAL